MNIKLPLAVLLALAGSFSLSVAGQAGAILGPGVNHASQPAFIQLAQAEPNQATLMSEGGPLFARNCAPCHGNNGQGEAGPKLAGNAFVATAGNVITQIFNGNEDHGMPPFADLLNDRQIAAIATFVRNSWGNSFGIVTPDTVKRTR